MYTSGNHPYYTQLLYSSLKYNFEKQVHCCHGYSGCLQKKHLVSLAELQVWFKVPCKEEMATRANSHFGFVDTTDNY